jgi:hypothetical protein
LLRLAFSRGLSGRHWLLALALLTLLHHLVVQLLVLGLAALPRGQLGAEPDKRNLVVVDRVGWHAPHAD